MVIECILEYMWKVKEKASCAFARCMPRELELATNLDSSFLVNIILDLFLE